MREPLDAGRLRARLVSDGPYAALDVVGTTGSTNTDLVSAAKEGARDRTVLIAEEQQAGRGRMQRVWVSPRGSGLYLSVLLRPTTVQQAALAWLPLLAGVALADTVQRVTSLRPALKWPNDLLLNATGNWCKAAGILAEGVVTTEGTAVVLGIGINVSQRPDELPDGAGRLPATSLAAQGAEVDREEFAVELLRTFADLESRWREHGGDALASGVFDRYQQWCGTLGQPVRIELGADDTVRGIATEVDEKGRLLVSGTDGAITPVSAGDVVHLRSAPPENPPT